MSSYYLMGGCIGLGMVYCVNRYKVWNNIGYLSMSCKLLKNYIVQRMNMDPLETCVVGKYGNTISIPYKKLGKTYYITKPLRRDKIGPMMQVKVELVYIDGTIIDITQQPGIPYPYSAKHYEADNIVATNIITNNKVTYDNEKIPMYLEEMIYVVDEDD